MYASKVMTPVIILLEDTIFFANCAKCQSCFDICAVNRYKIHVKQI